MRTMVKWVATILVAALALSACRVAHDYQPQLEKLSGEPIETPVSAERAMTVEEGVAAALAAAGLDSNGQEKAGALAATAVATCPSRIADDMPPCTTRAGSTGSYARAAYICELWNHQVYNYQYPSMRTCMDAYIPHQTGVRASDINFYVVDLYKYFPVTTKENELFWAMVRIYREWWNWQAPILNYYNEFTCLYLVSVAGITGFTKWIATSGCGVAKGVAEGDGIGMPQPPMP